MDANLLSVLRANDGDVFGVPLAGFVGTIHLIELRRSSAVVSMLLEATAKYCGGKNW